MLDHLRLTVADVAAAYRLYARHDAVAPGLHHEPNYYATFFRDPNGFTLEVVTRIQPGPDTP